MVISEINYKSGTDLDSPDWLEFCNLGQEDINLNGWYFTDEDSNHVFTFDKDLFLSANQRIVISNNLNKFKSIYPSVIHYPGEFDFGLGTPSDQVNLYNNNDELIVSVHYSDNYPWPLSSDVAGRTLELRQPTSEENQPMSWFRGCIGGSPGSAYQYCDEHVAAPDLVAVNSFNVTAFPVPAGQFVNLNIQFAERPESCIVWVYGSMGNLLDKILLDDMDTGQNIYSLPLVEYPGNMLFIKVSNGNNEKTLKVLKLY